MGQFGDKFRKAREAKKLSYDDVSRVTKIGARMLQAIEDEHFDQLPGGVFNKGFIRAYAKHLGLNDEEAVTDYLGALRQAQIEANEFRDPHIPVRPPAVPEKRTQPMTTTPAPQPKPPSPKPQPVKAPVQVADEELPELQLPRAEHVRPRRQYPAERESIVSARLIAVAAVVVILAVAFFWMRHTRLTRTEAASVATKSAPAPTSQLPAAMPASVAPTTTASTQPTPASASLTNPPATKQPAAAPVPSPGATNSTSPAGKTPAENDVTVRIPAKPAPAAKPAPTMTLVIRATENSWISVVADGQLVSQETLIAPANTTVRATREITVKVGNAAAVSFVWNGKELPAQGAESEVKTLVFDASGMRGSTQ